MGKNVILILTSVLKIWQITNVGLSKVLAAYSCAPLESKIKTLCLPFMGIKSSITSENPV